MYSFYQILNYLIFNYCTTCRKSFCINVYDEDDNKLNCHIRNDECFHPDKQVINIIVDDYQENPIFTHTELEVILSIIRETIYNGDGMNRIRQYLNIFDKIDDFLKKKR